MPAGTRAGRRLRCTLLALVAIATQVAPNVATTGAVALPPGWSLAADQNNVMGRAIPGKDAGDVRFVGTFGSWDACVGNATVQRPRTPTPGGGHKQNGPFNSLVWFPPPGGGSHRQPSPFDGNCFGVRGTEWRPQMCQGVQSARGPKAVPPPCTDDMDCELNGEAPPTHIPTAPV